MNDDKQGLLGDGIDVTMAIVIGACMIGFMVIVVLAMLGVWT